MKIKEILIESLKSPFANLLALANLIMLTTVESLPLSRGDNSITILMHQLNAPAILASMMITGTNGMSIFIPPFVYLQWIIMVAFAQFLRFHVGSEKV